ncbi:MAG: porin [Candidatus Dadabacteria bacterium]
MKILFIILIFAAICLPLSVVNSQEQSTETNDTENTTEVPSKQEHVDHPVIKEVVSRPKAFYNFFKSHYDGGLVFETKNKNFRVRYRTLIQFQFVATNNDDSSGTETEFFFRRFRLKFDGHAFRPWLIYRLQLSRDDVKLGQGGDSSGVEFKDFYIDAVYFDKISSRIGQFKVPFNREQLTSGTALLLVERSIVNSEFSYGRKIGGALFGFLGSHLAYDVGVFTALETDDTSDASSLDSEAFSTRIQLNFGGTLEYSNGGFPTGGDYALVPDFTKVPIFVSGAALVYIPALSVEGKENEGDSSALIERFIELGISKGNVVSITGDASYKLPMFNVEAAYTGRWINPDNSGSETVYDQGIRIQTGLFLMPELIEIAGRWAFISYDTSPGVSGVEQALRDTSSELTSGINYYISKNNNHKLQLSYSFINETFTQGAPNEDEKTLRVQFQVQF